MSRALNTQANLITGLFVDARYDLSNPCILYYAIALAYPKRCPIAVHPTAESSTLEPNITRITS